MIRTLAWCATALYLAATAAFAATRDLSAEMVVIESGRVVDTMKLHISGQKTRMDMPSLVGTISIVRRDWGVVWVLYPQERHYMEHPLDARYVSQDPSMDPPGLIRKESAGMETVNGYLCTRYILTLAAPTGAHRKATAWFADALGLNLRSEILGLTTELRNIRLGRQPASLFEIPAGWQKTEAPPRSTLNLPSNLPAGVADRLRQAAAGQGAAVPLVADERLAQGRDLVGAGQRIAGGQTRAPERATTRQITGDSSGMERNTDRTGSDYRDFSLVRANPELCQSACAREGRCRAWTYVKPGAPGEQAHCWLKNEVPDPAANECCVSGVKGPTVSSGMEPNTDRTGFDYRDLDLASPNPALCRDLCAREGRCRAWTYVKPGAPGDPAHCWLKSQVPEAGRNDCCVSGVKASAGGGLGRR